MILDIKKLILPFVLFFSMQLVYSQLGFSHEIGVIAGPVAYKSDFGVRSNFETNAGNTGIGIGIVHYISFDYSADCNCYTTDTYFNDHFKVRSEIGWNKTSLKHYGEWVNSGKDNANTNRLKGHTGEAQNWDVGMQLEYFPRSIRAFSAGLYSFAPFISLGAHFVSYQPNAFTNYVSADPSNPNDIGNIEDPNNFFSGWEPGSISAQNGSTWSVVSSVGTRYKLTLRSDLMLDLRFQYFFNDWTDGLNHQLPSNKANDWLVWLNFGYIYYLH